MQDSSGALCISHLEKGPAKPNHAWGRGLTFTADLLHLGFQLVPENQIAVNELAKATKVLSGVGAKKQL